MNSRHSTVFALAAGISLAGMLLLGKPQSDSAAESGVIAPLPSLSEELERGTNSGEVLSTPVAASAAERQDEVNGEGAQPENDYPVKAASNAGPASQQYPPNEIEITVPYGAKLPVALALSSSLQADEQSNDSPAQSSVNFQQSFVNVQSEQPLTEAQQQLTDQLAADFATEIRDTQPEGGDGSRTDKEDAPETLARWRNAAARSDDRLRSLLGHDLYNREIIRAHHSYKNTPLTH